MIGRRCRTNYDNTDINVGNIVAIDSQAAVSSRRAGRGRSSGDVSVGMRRVAIDAESILVGAIEIDRVVLDRIILRAVRGCYVKKSNAPLGHVVCARRCGRVRGIFQHCKAGDGHPGRTD